MIFDPEGDAEWERVASNPDNLIISPVLRDLLPGLEPEAEAESPLAVLPTWAHLEGDGLAFRLHLTRLSRQGTGWQLTGIAPLAHLHDILREPPTTWQRLRITAGELPVTELPIRPQSLRLTVELATTDGLLTLECEPPEDNT